MTRIKHIFRQDVPHLRGAKLGDTAVRALAIHYLISRYDLDARVIPPDNERYSLLYSAVLGAERILQSVDEIPAEFREARESAPTELDWSYGLAAWNVLEGVMWESGFFQTSKMWITPPVVFRSNPQARAVMIYPNEYTDGNRMFDSQWWIETCGMLRNRGYAIHFLGNRDHEPLGEFYSTAEFDREFPPTIDGLQACAAASSIAVGTSTGPTWALLFSDIRQVVIESYCSTHGFWFFERCQPVLAKKLHIATSLDRIRELLL